MNEMETQEDLIDQDFYNDVMQEYVFEENARIAKEKASNDRLLNLLGAIKGKQWVKDLLRLADDCGCFGTMTLSRRPHGDPQKEEGFGKITQIWVYQTTYGDCCDCFCGTIWVEIRKGRYLKLPFSS